MSLNIHDEVRKNKIKSTLIILLFFGFVGFLGGIAAVVFSLYSSGVYSWGSFLFGLIMAFIVSGIYIWIFWLTGEKMILSTTGAKLASPKQYPHLYHTTEALSIAAGLKKPPKCYVIQDPSLNAYATGFRPEKSHIVVTTGLLNKLNRQEMEGVLAHEISHIQNQDIRVMLLAAGLVGATVLLADFMFRMFLFAPRSGGSGGSGGKNGAMILVIIGFWIFLVILSPIIGQMIKLAISRRREYLADANGALLTRYPEGLASALEKIKNDGNELRTANKATAHLFISNPFKRKSTLSYLFATHPPIDNRISRLRGKSTQ